MGIKSDVLPQNMPVPMDDVRLVFAMTDGNTTKDYIVQHAHVGRPYTERPRWSKMPRYTRYVSGLNIRIPWPTEEAPEYEDGAFDTTRMEVEENTWVPSLDNSPFPSTIIDELRNKYSRFRTRHDEEYVRKKVMEEYRLEYLSQQAILTPAGELKKMKVEQSIQARQARTDEDGNLMMDSETTNFIERFMSQNAASKPNKKARKAKQSA
jgi:large subunit ribosomal protein L24